MLSLLPLLQCSSVCSNHINIPQSCAHQGDPTPTGWLLSSPDLPATAHTAAHSLLPLRETSRMALSPPSLHFLPGLSSPPVISSGLLGLKSSPLYPCVEVSMLPPSGWVLCKVLPPAQTSPLSCGPLYPTGQPDSPLDTSVQGQTPQQSPQSLFSILCPPPGSPNCHSTSRLGCWHGPCPFTGSTSIPTHL